MPIVELPVAESPLNQGDILRDVTLYSTKEGWGDKGGEAAKAPFKLCLVASRPCVIAHKQAIIVAGVEKYPSDTPRECNTFDRVLDFMTSARDGITSPDVFYLGQLPGRQGRHCVRLESLHTIEIPPPGKARDDFVVNRRIAALSPDFLRALHCRLFSCFATLGFEDHAWPSTEDLQWIVNQGQADISKIEVDVKQRQAQKASREAEGKMFSDKELSGLEAQLEALRERVRPYQEELVRRTAKSGTE